jgi:hypothetical protein
VDPAALHRRAGHHRLDGLAQAEVGVGNDQLHSSQPPGLQRRQERRPERPILAVAHAEAKHLPPTITSHARGHHHGLGDHTAVDPGLAVGGVQKHVREHLAGQRPIPKRANLGVQVGADAGDLAFADAAVGTKRPHQVVDLAGGDAMQVGLHHHREQRLIDPPAPLQQAGEERPGPQLGDPQLQIPGRGGQQPRAVPVALSEPVSRPLMRGGADHLGELGLDQGLVDGLGGLADAVVALRGRECVQDLQQCRLVKGHRACVLSREPLAWSR